MMGNPQILNSNNNYLDGRAFSKNSRCYGYGERVTEYVY